MSRVILVDPDAEGRRSLAERLRRQGYTVETAENGACAAELALANPPSTVIADLWMPGVSGLQLCRLLRAEPATADVPFILRAEKDDPKSRFWAERAGAVALVSKGRMGELFRILRQSSASAPESTFFMELGGGTVDVRDRIATHLDAALFESVVAAEVRSLASACAIDGVFDALSQLLSQLTSYHWLALTTPGGDLSLHVHPACADRATGEARAALGLPDGTPTRCITDDDAAPLGADKPVTVVRNVLFGKASVARIAVGVGRASYEVEELVALVARELGGAIRLATVVEDSRRLAATDALTGLANRRTFVADLNAAIEHCDRRGTSLCVLLLDVDHFKQVNDRFGHASGDAVLARIGAVLPQECRVYDAVARWGGEEFVVALPDTTLAQARDVAERIRVAVEQTVVHTPTGHPIPLTISVGVAARQATESKDSLLDRADRAMYAAKTAGRNRVCVAAECSEMKASAVEDDATLLRAAS
jgi:two-component system cell cycle response regulator